MANRDHLRILKQGVVLWNSWRVAARTSPDLSDANLRHLDLQEIDFTNTDLQNASLNNTSLDGANLTSANLTGACLWRTSLNRANLRCSVLLEADLRGAKLANADLSHANIGSANLTEADCSYARFQEANLEGVIAARAIFNHASFEACILHHATLSECTLRNTIFRGTRLGATVMANIDFSTAVELAHAHHDGPSSLGLDSLYASRGQIPEIFLRGCGTPESMIEYAPSLTTLSAWEFYSVFISYSAQDDDFAKRLYNDLQGEGIRCWFAPNDLRIGDPLRHTIDTTIRAYDKLLLIFTINSVRSQWVEQEVETALAKERSGGATVLFPIRLDNYIFSLERGWPALIRNTRHIGDFSGWTNHETYQAALKRLVNDLKVE